VIGGAISGWIAPSRAVVEHRPIGVGLVRSVLADAAWLSADVAWEHRNAAETRYWLALTLAADPSAEYYWVNAARILAYDLPNWDASGGPAGRSYRQRRAALEALGWLERGLVRHPGSFGLEIEMGNIALYGLGDRARAAMHYRRAAGSVHAVPFASRIARRLEAKP
jgi:hypothetical protein